MALTIARNANMTSETQILSLWILFFVKFISIKYSKKWVLSPDMEMLKNGIGLIF